MPDETEQQTLPSENTSSSQSESDEEPSELEDAHHPYGLYSGPFYDPRAQQTTQIVFEYQAGRKVARLRSPRDLYGVSSASFFQLPRWPYECQVLKDRIEHMEWEPPFPEPMYKSTGLEPETTFVDPSWGKVIYQISEGRKDQCFMCSRVGGARSPLYLQNFEGLNSTLVFESRFESGNLQKVVQVGEHDYQLTLRTDLYTNRHTQWYYFQVKNMRAGVPYRFTIINFMKPTSLYNNGMRPLMYSEKEATTNQIGWHRIGDEIKYYRNNSGQDGQFHFSLSWTFQFPHSGDTCYFAYCYPYTYSNLQDYLAGVANDPQRSKYCKIRVLCHSLAGNIVYVLTITNPSPATEKAKKKRAVILTARVHPGETNSSWMMKGFLDFILSSHSDAALLRDSFVFKVVPMLNPDGVIVGNYRCSLTGRDLNRNYKSRLKDSFPSIWFTRNMIKRVMGEREVLLYCDLHGHSRKQNVFMYGCTSNGNHHGGRQLYERLFPFMLSKHSPDKFSFSGCKFKVQRSKEGTGRVVMWKMGIQNSYTLEATFCGSTLGDRHGTHFSTKDLESLGHHFCSVLLDYCNPDQTKYYTCLREMEDTVKQRVNHHLSEDSKSFVDVLSDLDSSTGGSDSSDSNGPPAHLIELAGKVKPRKKLLRSKRERNSQRQQFELTHLQELQGNPVQPKNTLRDYFQITAPMSTSLDNNERARGKARTGGGDQPLNSVTSETSASAVSVSGGDGESPALETWTTPNYLSMNSSAEKPKPSRKGLKRIVETRSKLQSKTLLPDVDARKVSVVYLVFNAKGEVITSKSLNCPGEQNVKIAGSFSGFPWSRPFPVLRSLFPQKLPFSGSLEPSCYYIIPEAIGNTPLSDIPGDGREIGSGDGKHIAAKHPMSSLDGIRKYSSDRDLWTGETALERNDGSSLLPEAVIRPTLLPPSRISGSAPPSVPNELLKDQSGHCVRRKHKDKCSSAPLNRGEHGRSDRKKKEKVHLKEMKEETTFTAVTNIKEAKVTGKDGRHVLHPTADTKMGQVQNISPKMASHVPPPTTSGLLLPRKLKDSSANGILQKRKLGGISYPHPQEDQAVNHRQPPTLPVNTWRDLLIGLEAEGGGASKVTTPFHLTPFTPNKGIQRTNGFVSMARKQGQRVSLAPISK